MAKIQRYIDRIRDYAATKLEDATPFLERNTGWICLGACALATALFFYLVIG